MLNVDSKLLKVDSKSKKVDSKYSRVDSKTTKPKRQIKKLLHSFRKRSKINFVAVITFVV